MQSNEFNLNQGCGSNGSAYTFDMLYPLIEGTYVNYIMPKF